MATRLPKRQDLPRIAMSQNERYTKINYIFFVAVVTQFSYHKQILSPRRIRTKYELYLPSNIKVIGMYVSVVIVTEKVQLARTIEPNMNFVTFKSQSNW